MKRMYSCVFILECTALALLCACADIDSSTQTYSERCLDDAKIKGYQADFGGYKKGKTIPFKHSDGYLFSLAVTDRNNYLDELCQKQLNTTLESAYPIYSISLSVKNPSFYYDSDDKEKHEIVEARFGQYVFSLVNPLAHKEARIVEKVGGKDSVYFGPDSLYFDEMEINGVTYKDVAVSYGSKYEDRDRKSSVESDAKLYYQTKKGILKIEMEDGSHIAINEKEDD